MLNFYWEILIQALKGLGSNKVRTGLTMLGVIIGIFSVITLVTIGEGAKSYVTGQIRNMGAGYDSFFFAAGKDTNSPPNPKLSYADVAYLKNSIPEVRDMVALNPGTGTLTYGKKEIKTPVTFAVSANYFDLMGGKLTAGRFFTQAEVEGRRKLAVIGPTIAATFFGESSPLGERIRLKGDQFLVIGVTEARGSYGPIDMDKRVIVPVTTADNIAGNDKIMRLSIFPKDVSQIALVQDKVSAAVIKRTRNDDFRFMTQQGILNIVSNILGALTGFVTGIAAISLLVGGIGIMNIMLVAVNERVREIGVRKAIGARSRDIILQFLVESMLISLLGGLLGIILGIFGAFLIMYFIKGTLVIAWWAVVLATVVSAAVGIFFGVYPAVRAARLDPVEALRYE
jgi:putative ABC transport system permease protein